MKVRSYTGDGWELIYGDCAMFIGFQEEPEIHHEPWPLGNATLFDDGILFDIGDLIARIGESKTSGCQQVVDMIEPHALRYEGRVEITIEGRTSRPLIFSQTKNGILDPDHVLGAKDHLDFPGGYWVCYHTLPNNDLCVVTRHMAAKTLRTSRTDRWTPEPVAA